VDTYPFIIIIQENNMMHPLFNLSGKTALVTGGSRGVGYMIANGLLQAGAKVYIAARKMTACQQAAEALSKFGQCIALGVDLSSSESIHGLADTIKKTETKLDILINNAGKTWGASFDEFPDSGWATVLDVNLKGVFNLTRDLLPLLKKAATRENHASIINIGSMSAFSSSSMTAYSYGASKAALHQLTRVLALEFAPFNITVNAIAPGRFPSKMTQHLLDNKEAYEKETAQIPLGRYGEEEDIAALAVSICSHGGAYMTGNIIPLDGGANLVGMELQ
jgi:NAD(P)-dependent dehydrogenase (short-subunit alcohol dehydrogenase family)